MTGRRSVLNQDGNLMLMVVLVFLVISILGTAIISIASMENKISHYTVNAQQAQQAADAGAEWAIEQIWKEGLPEIFNEQLVIDELIKTDIKVTDREDTVIDPGNGILQSRKSECRYQFTVQSDYCAAKQKLEVEVVYSYSGTNPLQYDKVDIKSYQY
ncbi:MAG: PilX N-terminal domain-containing pilus assembly protein [Syntrophomonas sp.]